MKEINWALIQQLAAKPHKHLNIVEGAQYGLLVNGAFSHACNGVGEVMEEARTVQHLCDLAGIPEGCVYDAHIDARVYLLLAEVLQRREQLDRITSRHTREGCCCTECGYEWPCDTRRMADGTWTEENET
jgi:hypothetical protein